MEDAPRAHTGAVVLVAVLIGLLALPWLLGRVVGLVRRELDEIAEQRRPRGPATVPIERVTGDLRRLRAQLEARENRPGLSGKGMRMGAVRRAYVEVLVVACRQLEVSPPRPGPGSQASLAEIYRVEAELRQCGLDVRQPVHGHSQVA